MSTWKKPMQGALPLSGQVVVRARHGDDVDYASLLRRPEVSLLIEGDAANVLEALPTGLIQTVVTSPPYWSLRDYHIDGQIGLEDSLVHYIKALQRIFDQVLHVLRDDGTLWLNIGDSYTSGGRTWRAPDKKNRARAMDIRPPTPEGLKPKDLIGVPWRLAFALQDAGWYLRSDIIWHKPNCQPESVGDRPTSAHEYLFLMSKSEQYYYDIDTIRGPNERRLRTVWSINTRPVPEAHFATFPPELVRPCVINGSSEGGLVLDPFLGSGTLAEVAVTQGRRFVGIELNPRYLDIAVARLEKQGVACLAAEQTQALGRYFGTIEHPSDGSLASCGHAGSVLRGRTPRRALPVSGVR